MEGAACRPQELHLQRRRRHQPHHRPLCGSLDPSTGEVNTQLTFHTAIRVSYVPADLGWVNWILGVPRLVDLCCSYICDLYLAYEADGGTSQIYVSVALGGWGVPERPEPVLAQE